MARAHITAGRTRWAGRAAHPQLEHGSAPPKWPNDQPRGCGGGGGECRGAAGECRVLPGLAAAAARAVRAPGWMVWPRRDESACPAARPPAPSPGLAPAPAGLFMIDVRLVLLWRYQSDIDHGRRGPWRPAAMITTVSPGRCAGNRSRSRDPPRRRRRGTVTGGPVADRAVADRAV